MRSVVQPATGSTSFTRTVHPSRGSSASPTASASIPGSSFMTQVLFLLQPARTMQPLGATTEQAFGLS